MSGHDLYAESAQFTRPFLLRKKVSEAIRVARLQLEAGDRSSALMVLVVAMPGIDRLGGIAELERLEALEAQRNPNRPLRRKR